MNHDDQSDQTKKMGEETSEEPEPEGETTAAKNAAENRAPEAETETESAEKEAPLSAHDLSALAEEAVRITREILSFFPRVQAPKVTSRIENGSIWVDIEGDPTGRLIGRKGQTILAFQHILSKIVSHKLRKKITIHVDAEKYRKRHLEKLIKLAIQTADYVAATKNARALEPMPAADRRLIHLTLKSRKDVITVSEGKDPNRFVVIWPNQEE